MLKSWPLIAACVLCTSVQLFAGEPSPKIKAFFKPAMLDILNGVEHVDVFRVKQTRDGFEVLANGAVWKDDKARQVASLFLNEKSYEWERKKLCDPMPGVLFKLYKGDEFLEAALCFECDMVTFRVIDAKGKAIATVTNDFDPARAQLVKWAKEALPNDTVVKAMKESK